MMWRNVAEIMILWWVFWWRVMRWRVVQYILVNMFSYAWRRYSSVGRARAQYVRGRWSDADILHLLFWCGGKHAHIFGIVLTLSVGQIVHFIWNTASSCRRQPFYESILLHISGPWNTLYLSTSTYKVYTSQIE